MAIAVVFPFAGQRVIEVAAGQRDVGSEQPDNLAKLGIERPAAPPSQPLSPQTFSRQSPLGACLISKLPFSSVTAKYG